MGICNRCTLKGIKRQAKKDGLKVTISKEKQFQMGGYNIYVHPKEAKKFDPNYHIKYFTCWLMKIPERCQC